MNNTKVKRFSLTNILRAFVEIAFIIFLFYSNLLMGEYDKTGNGQKHGFVWALGDVLTTRNFFIGVCAAIVGYIVFEFLRKKSNSNG